MGQEAIVVAFSLFSYKITQFSLFVFIFNENNLLTVVKRYLYRYLHAMTARYVAALRRACPL